MKNKSNTEPESCEVVLLRKAQDLDNHWCWSFFMKLNKPQREISAAATTPGSTFSIRSLLSISTGHLLFLGDLPRVILLIQVIKVQG